MISSLVPTFILFIITAAGIATTVVILNSQINHNQLSYQDDLAKVNDHLRAIQTQQNSYAQQVKTLTKLVSETVNATDEYIQNITSAVSETQDVITHDMATVQDIQDNQRQTMAVQFAGMFTILVILVSGYHISQHLRHMHSPVVQRKIMAVLWMTPIYSVTSWLSLVFTSSEPYLAVVREFYEAYCVYMFLSFLISVLGRGNRHAVVDLLEQRADQLNKPDGCRCGPKAWKRCWVRCCSKRKRVPHQDSNDLSLVENDGEAMAENNGGNATGIAMTTVPSSLEAHQQPQRRSMEGIGYNPYNPARMKAEAVLDQCQLYAMQFVLLRPVTAIGWLVSNQLCEPKQFLDPTTPQLYITIVTNCSIFFAFRGLVRFYHATRSNLAWCNPWPKFLCIKGVVFMTFWQRMMLSLIINLGYADKFDSQEDANDFIMQAQNFLICLEMLFSAVAHCFVFSPDEWADGYRAREEARRKSTETRAFGDSVALGDFISDVKVVMAAKKRRKQRKKLQQEALSPSSTFEEDEANNLDTSLSQESSAGDSETMMTLGNNIRSDPLDGEFSIDDGENIMGLSTPPPSSPRRRFDTEDSVDSNGGEVIGSLDRIERFINEHSPKKPGGTKEIV